jgi:hypothetical protein
MISLISLSGRTGGEGRSASLFVGALFCHFRLARLGKRKTRRPKARGGRAANSTETFHVRVSTLVHTRQNSARRAGHPKKCDFTFLGIETAWSGGNSC